MENNEHPEKDVQTGTENLLPLDFEEGADNGGKKVPELLIETAAVEIRTPAPILPAPTQAPAEKILPAAKPLSEAAGGSSENAAEKQRQRQEHIEAIREMGRSGGRQPGKTLADELAKKKSVCVPFGNKLREMRECRGISLDEVADKTRIRRDFLEALEKEEFKKLPPAVFVCAYVRKICDLYNIPREMIDDMIKQLKENADYALTEDIVANMIEADQDASPEAEQKIRSVFWLAGAVMLFLVAVLTAVILLSVSGREKAATAPTPTASATTATATVPGTAFDPARLQTLTPPQYTKMTELPLEN